MHGGMITRFHRPGGGSTRRLNLSDFSKKCAYGTPELGAGLVTGGTPGGLWFSHPSLFLTRRPRLPRALASHAECPIKGAIKYQRWNRVARTRAKANARGSTARNNFYNIIERWFCKLIINTLIISWYRRARSAYADFCLTVLAGHDIFLLMETASAKYCIVVREKTEIG